MDASLKALLVMALEAARQICALWGESGAQNECAEALARLRCAPPAIPIQSKQASSLLALSGLHCAAHINAEVLGRDPLGGLSTFYGFYVLQARARVGDYVGALEVIRRYWGAMLDLGATSFWEDFDLSWADGASRIDELPIEGKSDLHFERGDYCYKSWRHSLCHGWAAGPTAWLSQHVLGVQILQAGAQKVGIAPQLGDLEWAQGTFPTPHGPLRVKHRRSAGKIEIEWEAPEGLEVI